jgi:hypothetical protein
MPTTIAVNVKTLNELTQHCFEVTRDAALGAVIAFSFCYVLERLLLTV